MFDIRLTKEGIDLGTPNKLTTLTLTALTLVGHNDLFNNWFVNFYYM